VSLFGEEGGAGPAAAALIAAREWSEAERLAQEKTSLGFYLSGHPYHAHAAELSRLVQQPLGAPKPTQTPVRIAGIVVQLRTQTSRRGKMAFVTRRRRDQPEIVIFNETFDANRHLLREDAVLVAEVKVQQRVGDDGQVQGLRIIADAVYDLAGARRKWARALRLSCNGSSSAQRLFDLIEPFRRGHCPVTINYSNQASGGDIELGSDWQVNLDEHLLAGLREWLAPENVTVVY
jgi:DNA polymerase-3 subunit alpha